ncbi:uncharacterized protein N7446_010805 [Penicillium canescens]|uniref:Uncharacterized protein n=1 Tax=Penicillium canescens TaxID=5083 RepID=A0AAD6IBP1_PENCN|nr:uncharacterized protein N7446_010805 [Penicillium canescens]KAJ6041305.1 hypothetical protein N7460_006695 [Penicillium canescens]KAJ6050696.1 hypothetical protein N7446_010805 [Penicillium canescens]KAJ6065915.1 hypothetical protein N7444_001568 [Penicillium canescens]
MNQLKADQRRVDSDMQDEPQKSVRHEQNIDKGNLDCKLKKTTYIAPAVPIEHASSSRGKALGNGRWDSIQTKMSSLVVQLRALISEDGKLTWSKIHSFQEPGVRYNTSTLFRHKDTLGREWHGCEDDRYLSATDGRLSQLIVQATGEICNGPQNSTWARTKIRDPTPMMLRVMLWVLRERLMSSQASDMDLLLKWAPSCLVIFLLLFVPADLGGEVRNDGNYEHFKYHYWGYAAISSNPREHPPSTASLALSNQESNPISQRLLRPRYLCFLKDGRCAQPQKVSEWEAEHGKTSVLQYIFVAYTTEQFSHGDVKDLNALHYIAEAAARRAGVQAYWIACSCMPDEHEMSEDIYRISDVVRGSHSLSIVVGPPVKKGSAQRYSTSEFLLQWGRRMWTFPEVLLSPNSHPIAIYTRGSDIESPLLVRKRNFPAEAWPDALKSRQLVDHYESSIVLGPLELMSIALQCLGTRETREIRHHGDLSYILMGLLRRRPKVDPENSAFQAFCRLSLSNDSHQLLERLICLLPGTSDKSDEPDKPWYTIDDVWDRNLWDIQPLCQVVGVGHDDTVILSGSFGTPIRWKSFAAVNLRLRNTMKRSVAKVALRAVPIWFLLGVFLLRISQSKGGDTYGVITGVGWLFMGATIIIVVISPYLLSYLYVGKVWSAQPWVFGFEGYMPIDRIERNLLGVNLNRLKWSPYGSELSRHREVCGECVGVDPTSDPDVNRVVSDSWRSGYGQMRVFTLVDSNTMSVTLFRAVRPPVAMLLCGGEGGMQRALLCSYDWRSQSLYRETVLRVDTLALEKMPRVNRFRLGLRRPLSETVPTKAEFDGADEVV